VNRTQLRIVEKVEAEATTMRTLGTMLSGLCLFAWVAYLSWPVSVDGNATPRQTSVVEMSKPSAEPAPMVDASPTSDNLEPAV
jgi:hypothetical protein